MARQPRIQRLSVAMEVTRSRLHLAILERSGLEGPLRVRARSLIWRQDCNSLHGELGCREMTLAMSRLADQERLAGQAIHLTLNSDYCVTRVATGSAERVKHELDELRERSQLYLRLGHGPKSLGTSVQPLDARRHHAVATVTNRRTLEALAKAAAGARLEIDRIEASTVALCRCLAGGGYDADEPALIVTLCERELGLAVSYRGRLLLDYRPGGRDVQDHLPLIIQRHRQRLERYTARICGLGETRIRRAFLCGPQDAAQAVREALRAGTDLSAEVMEPAVVTRHAPVGAGESHSTIAAPSTLAVEVNCDEATGSESCAALGTCLSAVLPGLNQSSANLMETIRAAHRAPLRGLLVRTLWPAAAAATIAAGIFAASTYERWQVADLKRQIEALEPERARVAALQTEIQDAQMLSANLRRLRDRLPPARHSKLLAAIAQCMPAEVWLDRVEVEGGRQVRLRGTAFGDESVFEFTNWLSQAPGIGEVQLEGTTATQLTAGPATKFEVKLDLDAAGVDTLATEKNDGNDRKTLSFNPFPPKDRHNRNFGAGSLGASTRRR